MRIVLLGAPGSGKGTQSRSLSEKYNVPQISTGDLLRAAISAGSKLGKQAKAAMNDGQLVQDDLVLQLIEERLMEADTKPGFLLDGFPRNIPQAQALDNRLRLIGKNIQLAINVHVEQRDLMKRLIGRITCGNCGEIYNENTRKPKTEGVCDVCESKKLNRRDDDNEETIASRFEVYNKETAPLIAYYRAQQKLRTVKGVGKPGEISKKICDVIDADLRPLGARVAGEDPKAPEPIRIVLPPTEEEKAAEAEAKRKEEEKLEKERLKAEKKAAQEKAREEKRKAAEKKKADAAKKKIKDAERKAREAEKKKAAAEKKKEMMAKKKAKDAERKAREAAKKEAAREKARLAKEKAAEKKKAAAEKKKAAAEKKKAAAAKKVSKKKTAKKVTKKVSKKKTAKKVAKKATKKVAKKVSKKKTAKKVAKKATKKVAKKVSKKAAKKKAKKKAAKRR